MLPGRKLSGEEVAVFDADDDELLESMDMTPELDMDVKHFLPHGYYVSPSISEMKESVGNGAWWADCHQEAGMLVMWPTNSLGSATMYFFAIRYACVRDIESMSKAFFKRLKRKGGPAWDNYMSLR